MGVVHVIDDNYGREKGKQRVQLSGYRKTKM